MRTPHEVMCPSPRYNRRRMMQVGSAGMFGLSLPRLLLAQEDSYGQARTSAKSCIYIVISGGLSHVDTLDPKPLAPPEVRGPYGTISTSVPGVHVTEMLPQLAKLADRYTIVRTMSHGQGAHVTAAHTMLTGQPDGRRTNDSPFVGSLVSRFRPSSRNVPSYVWLHNMKTGTNKIPRYNSGLGKVGFEHAPLHIGYELDNPTSPDFRVRHFDPPDGLDMARLSERMQMVRGLDAAGEMPPNARATDAYGTFMQRAYDMVTGPRARQAFQLRREPQATRDRYGRHPMGQYFLMARRLVEAGVRLVTVTAWPGLAPGETEPTITQVWDMHDIRYSGSDNMFGNGPFGMKWSLPRLDQSLSALIEDLDDRGLLDETLVAVVTEFGRTPKFEGKGRGRGHWPDCYSLLMAGGGIRRGDVYGSSDSHGAYVAGGRAISHADFGATLLDALGIPPETRFGPDGFSFRASDGKVVDELFA